jgi:hypothetical protein
MGYDTLSAYCGGENSFAMAMPKTCPCVMSPCKDPEKLMFYVLPHPHTPLEPESQPLQPPPPPSDRLAERGVQCQVLEGSSQLCVAVVKFSGYATPDVVFNVRDKQLKPGLQRDGIACRGDEEVMIAQYNELYSLPWNRDNEIWLPVTWPEETPVEAA